MTRHPLALMLAAAFSCHSQPTAAETVLDTVSVEAEALDETGNETATVTRISAEQIKRNVVGNIKEAVRYEPGISVTNNPSRFGLSGYNIRGVDGERVAMQIDGVRLPDAFSIGGFSNAGRNLVDVRLLRQIDIQRGSSSVMFGSGALGGAVNYVTPEPEDWLGDGRTIAGGIEAQYHGANDARALIPTLAAGGDTLKFLLTAVRETGTETETQGTLDVIGPNRTVANPQDDRLLSALGKIVFTPHPDLRTTLTLENYARDIDTNVLSQIMRQNFRMNSEDRYRRQRISLDQRIGGLALGTLDIKLYKQTSNTRQDTFEDRVAGENAFARRIFDVDQDIVGLKLALDSVFEARGAHSLKWGFEASRRDTAEIRDGYTTDATTGDRRTGCYETITGPNGRPIFLCPPYPRVNQVNGQPYPERDYPISQVDEFALFAQDNWMLSDAWSVTLGFRADRYQLRVKPDETYLNPDRNSTDKLAPSDFSTQAFTPKLGATWRFAPGYALNTQYAWGFRAPPYDDVNFGFSNTSVGYVTLPNADLKSEFSQGPEIRLERRGARGYWNVSAYYTAYKNFIELEQLDCPADPLCASAGVSMVFQPRNLDHATIRGLEAGFSFNLTDRWRMRGAFAYTKGRDDTGNPLDSIDPMNASLGLAYMQPDWQIEASMTMAEGKNESDARRNSDGSLQRQFLPKGYAVLDLRAHWKFAKTGLASFGILNVLDRKYAQWADVPIRDAAHIADSGSGPDRYSQPGRNVAVSLNYGFK